MHYILGLLKSYDKCCSASHAKLSIFTKNLIPNPSYQIPAALATSRCVTAGLTVMVLLILASLTTAQSLNVWKLQVRSKCYSELKLLVCSSHKCIIWLQKTWKITHKSYGLLLWVFFYGAIFHHHYMEKAACTFLKNISFLCTREEIKNMQVCNDMRLTKLSHCFNFWVSYPF